MPSRPLRCPALALRAAALFASSLAACSFGVVVPPTSLALPTAGADSEICVAVQEAQERQLWQGVEDGGDGPWKQILTTFVIRHPRGVVLVDPAIGTEVQEDLRQAGAVARFALGDGSGAEPLVKVLARANMDPSTPRLALITHVHWDHVGALRDLPRTVALLHTAEWVFAREQREAFDHGIMRVHLDAVAARLRTFRFEGPAYEGFPRSFDVFGDGSIVAVPLPGHTPGSTGYFVNTTVAGKARRFLFVGDAAWTIEGVREARPKGFPANTLFDLDAEQTTATLRVLRAVHERGDVDVVPAHDVRGLAGIPSCG